MQDREVDPLKQGAENMNDIYVRINGASLEWQSSTGSGYRMKFLQVEVLAKTSGCTDRIIKEATEIKLHPENISREEGFKLSKARNPSTN
jgi:hypothetical protein